MGGNDRLYGQAGDDQLEGGDGNDTLRGDKGADDYHWAMGDGQDRITRADRSDRIDFDSGISKEDLWFSRSGNDLVIDLIGDEGGVKVSSWFLGDSYHVGEIQTDNSRLSHTLVNQLVEAMAAFNPPAPGQTGPSAEVEREIAPVIAANWQPA